MSDDKAKAKFEKKGKHGFASMHPDVQREIASKGGKAAHQKGVAHQWTAEEAKAAGKLGGLASHGGRAKFLKGEEGR